MNVNRPKESVNQIWQAIQTMDESSGADTVLYKDTVAKDKDKDKDLGSSRTAYFEYSCRYRYKEYSEAYYTLELDVVSWMRCSLMMRCCSRILLQKQFEIVALSQRYS
jgi:hypothetical protein